MYNVQLSEFWKQRCGKEAVHNAPFLYDGSSEIDGSDTMSIAPSQLSTTSTQTQQRIEELQKKLEEERARRVEVENMLKNIQEGEGAYRPPTSQRR